MRSVAGSLLSLLTLLQLSAVAQEGIESMGQACDHEVSAEACFKMGAAYFNGEGVARDRELARAYWEKACDAGASKGCLNLAVVYYKGQGVGRNFTIAKEYYAKACALDDPIGCSAFEDLKERGY